jgi:uncharacterized protein YdeI (YjbR/CyaY-like superfamily)
MEGRSFRTAAEWRAWLAKNHATKREIWLIYFKKGSRKKSLTYREALEEALCYGWIDSTVGRLDAERYKQRYTPRNPDSVWSASNKERVKRLITKGRMTEAGLVKIRLAKRNGSWTKLDKVERNGETPSELVDALGKNPKANGEFAKLPPSQKKIWSWWIMSAKRPETRARRVAAAVVWIEAGRRIGLETPRLGAEETRWIPGPKK